MRNKSAIRSQRRERSQPEEVSNAKEVSQQEVSHRLIFPGKLIMQKPRGFCIISFPGKMNRWLTSYRLTSFVWLTSSGWLLSFGWLLVVDFFMPFILCGYNAIVRFLFIHWRGPSRNVVSYPRTWSVVNDVIYPWARPVSADVLIRCGLTMHGPYNI